MRRKGIIFLEIVHLILYKLLWFILSILGDEKTEEPLPDFKDMKIDDSYTGPALLDSGK